MSHATVIRDLLNCAELNQDDLEPETVRVIEEARRAVNYRGSMPVMLRKGSEDDLFALFPEEAANELGTLCTCYCLVGGHTGADFHGCMDGSKPAKGEDAQRLLDALKATGYDQLRVVKRATRNMHARRMKRERNK